MERTLLVDPTQEVFSAHVDQISNGTVSVRTSADFKKYPLGTIETIITDHITHCPVCSDILPYARREPDPGEKANPLDGDTGHIASDRC